MPNENMAATATTGRAMKKARMDAKEQLLAAHGEEFEQLIAENMQQLGFVKKEIVTVKWAANDDA